MSETPSEVIVVSGLPRSGTSMAMRMLEVGGVPPVTDGERVADDSNPRGYYELEAVKKLPANAEWLEKADGKAVKIVAPLLGKLPTAAGRRYRVIVMRREIAEVLGSQATMLDRLGRPSASIDPARLGKALLGQLDQAAALCDNRSDMDRLDLAYADAVSDPRSAAEAIAAFLGRPMDLDAMAATVDPALYRQRGR
ncbi:MAG: sulfotransferase [Planctomycetota bacterium]